MIFHLFYFTLELVPESKVLVSSRSKFNFIFKILGVPINGYMQLLHTAYFLL